MNVSPSKYEIWAENNENITLVIKALKPERLSLWSIGMLCVMLLTLNCPEKETLKLRFVGSNM